MKRTKYSILNGGDETTVYHLQAPTDGPTAVVIGGLHGNERAGIKAADLIRLWSIESGEIIVIPRANKRACDRGTRQAAGAPDLNRQFPSGSSPEGSVAKGLWREITRHDPDYVFDLHRSVGLFQRSPSGVGMAIYPTPSGRSIAEAALSHLNEDHVPSGNAGFQIGNDQNGSNPLLSHKVGGDLDDTVGWLIETTSHDQEMDVRVTQLEHAIETLLYHADNGGGIVVKDYGHVDQEPKDGILDEFEEDGGGDDEEETPDTVLPHEEPLAGYHRSIGGSAGRGTHGGTDIDRPDGMPRKQDCDHVVRNARQFVNAVRQDDTSIYLDDDIDISVDVRANGGIDIGSNVTIVGGYCDPSIPGRGPELICESNGYRALTSGYNEAPSLWGVSFRGPELDYFDPDHTASDFSSKQSTGLFCYDTDGTLEVVGCEMRGWTMAGLEVGARSKETTAKIRRSTFCQNLMEHLGYGVELYNGDLSMDFCFLDRCRHGISGFGYPNCSWSLTNSVIGPGPWASHALDMHKLANSLTDGDETAGGDILIRRCSLMATKDVNGSDQESFALRGVPTGEAHIEKTHFWHESQPTETNVQGNAYRQEWDSWQNFYVEDCAFGAAQLADGVGAPRAQKAHEDDDQPEQEDPSGTPSEPSQPMSKLAIHGTGLRSEYRIVVDGGEVESVQVNPEESITDLGGGQTEIKGAVGAGADVFDLGEGTPDTAELSAPADIRLNGHSITSTLETNHLNEKLNDQQSQIDSIRDWVDSRLESLRIVSGDSE